MAGGPAKLWNQNEAELPLPRPAAALRGWGKRGEQHPDYSSPADPGCLGGEEGSGRTTGLCPPSFIHRHLARPRKTCNGLHSGPAPSALHTRSVTTPQRSLPLSFPRLPRALPWSCHHPVLAQASHLLAPVHQPTPTTPLTESRATQKHGRP